MTAAQADRVAGRGRRKRLPSSRAGAVCGANPPARNPLRSPGAAAAMPHRPRSTERRLNHSRGHRRARRTQVFKKTERRGCSAPRNTTRTHHRIVFRNDMRVKENEGHESEIATRDPCQNRGRPPRVQHQGPVSADAVSRRVDFPGVSVWWRCPRPSMFSSWRLSSGEDADVPRSVSPEVRIPKRQNEE